METNSTVPDIWRALSACRETATGLRSISVAQYGERELRAGIFFPEGTEALLTGFRERIPRALPQGRGFRVEVLAGDVPDASRNWIAILRSPGADAEMFAVMAEDLRQVLEKRSLDISVFLDRVRAWQAFMESGRPLEMSERAEAGLFGELVVLDRLMDMIGERRALQGWTGPRGMLHDFRFDEFALEVKTSTSEKTFPVIIGSLDQLDEGLVPCTLYLAGVRLKRDSEGSSVAELADVIAERLSPRPEDRQLFEQLLLRAGLLRAAGGGRGRFTPAEILVFVVNDAFPHLRRSALGGVFLGASYTLDLDRTECAPASFSDMTKECLHG